MALTGDSGGGPTVPPELSQVSDAHDPLIGETLAERYKLTRRMGEGGMGTVYEATDADRSVAVKVLRDKYADQPEVARRLVKEAKLASSIEHEHIVRILDTGRTKDGRPFIVMELLRGESLADRIRREGALTEELVIGIAEQAASALAAAHARTIVHRDIKPENVFLVTEGAAMPQVKIVDFGISKSMAGEATDSNLRLTATGMVLGTPLYMSPEQARGDDELDERVDVYALGVIMYEALTGEVPFRANNYLGVISQVLSAELIPPRQLRPELAISPALERVVMRAMQRDRTQRYASMVEMADDLASARSGKAPAETTMPPRARAMWPIIALLGSVTLAALSVPLWQHKESLPTIIVDPLQRAEQVAKVRITSAPSGAEILIAGKSLGTTPRELTLRRGATQITLTLAGYEPSTTNLDPDRQHELAVTLHALTPLVHPSPPTVTHPPHNAHPAKPTAHAPERPPAQQGEETLPNPY